MQPETTIDLDHLEKYVAGDDSLRNEILELYTKHVSNLGEQLDAAQTDESWRDTIHALKGAARGVGAWALGNLCEKSEHLTGAGNADQRSAALSAIQREIKASAAEANALRTTVR